VISPQVSAPLPDDSNSDSDSMTSLFGPESVSDPEEVDLAASGYVTKY